MSDWGQQMGFLSPLSLWKTSAAYPLGARDARYRLIAGLCTSLRYWQRSGHVQKGTTQTFGPKNAPPMKNSTGNVVSYGEASLPSAGSPLLLENPSIIYNTSPSPSFQCQPAGQPFVWHASTVRVDRWGATHDWSVLRSDRDSLPGFPGQKNEGKGDRQAPLTMLDDDDEDDEVRWGDDKAEGVWMSRWRFVDKGVGCQQHAVRAGFLRH